MESSFQSDDIINHELNETDFTKKDVSKFSLEKRGSYVFTDRIEIGNMNLETPISYFIKKFYNKSMTHYIAHTQVYLNNCINDTNYIFLMKNDILITTNYEDENNKNPNELHFIKFSPIIMKIDYRQVNFNFNIIKKFE